MAKSKELSNTLTTFTRSRRQTRRNSVEQSSGLTQSAGESPAAANDVVLEAEREEEAVPQSDAVLGSLSETLAEPEEPENEGVVDNGVAEIGKDNAVEDETKEIVGCGKSEGVVDKDNAVEDGGKEIVGSSNNNGKAKRVVKKTVKVVKKVIKKVPKRGSKVQNLDQIGGNSSSTLNPNPTISGGFEAEDLILAPIDIQLKAEDSNSDVPMSKKAEEEHQKIEIVEKGSSEAQYSSSILNPNPTISGGFKAEDLTLAPIDIQLKAEDSNSDVPISQKAEEEHQKIETVEKDSSDSAQKEEMKGSELMEVDNHEGKCGNENKDLGVNEGEMEGKEEETVNVAKQEDDVGEGKLFSGELEAMERRKRRKTEIFIGGLDKDAKEEDVRKVFSQAGEIVDLTVVMNGKTGKNKGFAFLRYASAADAKRALEKFSKVEICGKQCGATPVEGNDTIFLGNIDKKWKDVDILKLLQEIGIEKIDKVTVMVNPNNSECNRGFAFVEFETSKDAQIAYKKLQKKDVFGKNKNIKVAWAEPLKELDEEEMLKVKTVYAEFIPSYWDEEKVRDTFKKFGEIDDIVLARNLKTSKRKDFAFISYNSRESAVECIESFSRESRDEDGIKVNIKVSLAKPMTKSKDRKPVAKPVAKEVLKEKSKPSRNYLRPSEPRNRAQPSAPHYNIQIHETPSTNSELVQLLREQASWRPSHSRISNSQVDGYHSNSLSGRKRQFSVLEADPRYPELSRYPHSRLDASFPVASSSHNIVPTSGLTSSVAYHQRHGAPSGSLYGARNYQSDVEIRDRAYGSSTLHRRY